MTKKNVLIVTDYALHKKSGAAFSRMECYRKALDNEYNFYAFELDQFCSAHNAPEFKTTDKNTIFFLSLKDFKRSYFYRNFLKLFDFIRPLRLANFIKKNYSAENSFILLYTSHFFLSFITIFYLKSIFKYKVIVEKNELEMGIILNNFITSGVLFLPFIIVYPIKLILSFFTDFITLFASGIIVISTNLKKLYRFNKNVVRIPVIVDLKRFNSKLESRKDKTLIKFIYLGTLTQNKDAIFPLLEAVNSLELQYKNKAEFHLMGDSIAKIKNKIVKIISNNRLQNVVFLENPLPSNGIPLELSKYDVGLLLREKNLQTHYGFATKLGEYLAAGLPVLTNDISDNLLYLTNNVNSFIARTNFKLDIKSILIEIISQKNEIDSLKNNARDLARIAFDYQNYSLILTKIFS